VCGAQRMDRPKQSGVSRFPSSPEHSVVIRNVKAKIGPRDHGRQMSLDEYWSLGVTEYWIVDDKLQQALVLRRGRVKWTEKLLGPTDVCETKLLPGFKLPCAAIFEVAAENE
jgi:Putative restriction endonuclease